MFAGFFWETINWKSIITMLNRDYQWWIFHFQVPSPKSNRVDGVHGSSLVVPVLQSGLVHLIGIPQGHLPLAKLRISGLAYYRYHHMERSTIGVSSKFIVLLLYSLWNWRTNMDILCSSLAWTSTEFLPLRPTESALPLGV